jgi:type VI protein secretion system component Hcp
MATAIWFDKPLNAGDWLLSYSFSMEGLPNPYGSPGSIRRAQIAAFYCTIDSTSISARLVPHCAGGTVFPKVWIDYYRNPESDVDLEYELSNVTILVVDTNAKSTSVTLNYEKIASYRFTSTYD